MVSIERLVNGLNPRFSSVWVYPQLEADYKAIQAGLERQYPQFLSFSLHKGGLYIGTGSDEPNNDKTVAEYLSDAGYTQGRQEGEGDFFVTTQRCSY